MLLLIIKWVTTAAQGHKKSACAVRTTSALCSFVVFVQGMWKSSEQVPLCSVLRVGLADHKTLKIWSGGQRFRMVSSPKWQQPKKVANAAPHTAAWKGKDKSSACWSTYKWCREARGCGGFSWGFPVVNAQGISIIMSSSYRWVYIIMSSSYRRVYTYTYRQCN